MEWPNPSASTPVPEDVKKTLFSEAILLCLVQCSASKVVLFREASPEKIQEIQKIFALLPGEVSVGRFQRGLKNPFCNRGGRESPHVFLKGITPLEKC